ncbi:MAG: hypothetical protein LBF51_04150 [Zoogloeaceae bacterium]|nr:hypothetical protein [Zoogloeaceae bacterium]
MQIFRAAPHFPRAQQNDEEIRTLPGGYSGVRLALNGEPWISGFRHVQDVRQTGVVRGAWRRRQPITIHAWIYSLKDGLVHDLGMTIRRPEDLLPHCQTAMTGIMPDGA